MTLITKTLILQLKRIANFIVLEGENKECYWYDTNDICSHWRFVNEDIARKSANKIYSMFCDYKEQQGFIGMDMARKFLEMGFTRSRRYANHPSGKSTLEMVPYHRSRQPHYTVKSPVLQLFSKK